jgi:4a-hydroxytetrahydrobiopterin dehydratase
MAPLEYRKLGDSEVAENLSRHPYWALDGDQITRTVEFATYKDGIVFAAAVGYLADRLDHHPDLHIGYRRVVVSVSTHSVEGLSPYDFELARQIDGILSRV